MTTVYARLQSRRDTAANWTAANPVLAEGEIGFITDTKAAKIGDGVTAWNDLLTRPSQEQLVAVQAAAEQAAADADQRLTATVAAQTATETARDETQNLRNQTQTLAGDVASAIVYQDLASIAEQKALTMVAGFVYDTRLDTDGGAWRDRCRGTSWYNEELGTPTRGTRREFPTVAVIIAEADRVTVFDADDPSLPVWKLFSVAANNKYNHLGYDNSERAITSVEANNGVIAVGRQIGGVTQISFPLDKARTTSSTWDREILFLGQTGNDLPASTNFGKYIVDSAVNAVAMTVLSDAPVDPATGLQVPMIAVATDGGVSVIKHDGAVVNVTGNGGASYNRAGVVYFDQNDDLLFQMDSQYNARTAYRIPIPEISRIVEVNSANPTDKDFGRAETGLPVPLGLNSGGGPVRYENAFYSGNGMTLGLPNPADPANGMVHYLTSTWASGWLPGDIRGAFLASTDQTDLVASGELVTNGTFDTDVSGWTATGMTTFEAQSGRMRFTANAAGAQVEQTIATEAGKRYLLSFDYEQVSGDPIYDGTGLQWVSGSISGSGTVLFTFTGTGSDKIAFAEGGSNNNSDFYIDNVSVQLADDDRSVKGKGLIVHGTVSRAPVATGAELMGYGPFSVTDYLDQPYNPDLDFGTGDFCVMGWMKPDDTANRTFISYEGDDGWQLDNYVGNLRFWEYTPSGGGNKNLATTAASTALQFVCVTVVGRVVSMYVNGALVTTGATTSRSFQNGVLRLGRGISFLSYNAAGSQLTLWRISATAPTAAQIAKIYRDERRLFQPGAQCTLYGTSDAVTALAHDPVTGLLHAGTSAGRSDFDGLLRVGNTTTPVAAAIAASGGMILEG